MVLKVIIKLFPILILLELKIKSFLFFWFVERRTKKVAKLHFACQIRGPHCLYSKTCFTMRTRNPKTWIHLMFLDFQIRNYVNFFFYDNYIGAYTTELKNLIFILIF